MDNKGLALGRADISVIMPVYNSIVEAYRAVKSIANQTLLPLEYRSVRFETEVLDTPNFQGSAAVNYTDRETP